MERKIDLFLNKWKQMSTRKPLMIYGTKQIGKTYSVLEFGKRSYKNTVYLNAENNSELIELLEKEKLPDRILEKLSLMTNEHISEESSLLVFDNVNDIEIVKGIKFFSTTKSQYDIIMITSRRENLEVFKGEEFQFKGMSGLDFEEYLWAINEKQLATLIRNSFEKRRTCPFHKVALEYFMNYLKTGGLPEVVREYLNGSDDNLLNSVKYKTLDGYKKEIALNSNLIDIPRGIEVLDSIPKQLSKANKKFQYGTLGFGKRSSEYDEVIDNMVNNQILNRSYLIKNVRSPLTSCRQKDSFKLYLNDDGLLYSMMFLNDKLLLNDESVKETMYENHIAKTLVEAGYVLNYYQSNGKAEVHFVIQNRLGKIIPLELIVRANSKAKSLSVFMKKYTTEEAYRITENNFSTKKGVRYIPIYAVFCLNDSKI